MSETAKKDDVTDIDTVIEPKDDSTLNKETSGTLAAQSVVSPVPTPPLPEASEPEIPDLQQSQEPTLKPLQELPPLVAPPPLGRTPPRGRASALSIPPPPPPPPPPVQYSLQIQRGSMQDWRNSYIPMPRAKHPPIYAFYLRNPDAPSYSANDSDREATISQGTEMIYESKNLQRIWIVSHHLENDLQSITSVSPGTIIVGPPYKLFVRHMPGIKARISELKQELEQAKKDPDENEDLTDQPGDTTRNQDNLEIRLSHLQLLDEFLDDELQEVLSLRSQIADGTLESIQFEDLWHLFAPGDLVFSTDNGHEQLYKVYAVTGGQIQRRNRTREETVELDRVKERFRYMAPPPPEQDEEERIDNYFREPGSGIGTWSLFKVDCFMIVFNGEYCGPVEVCKKIRRYIGHRAITSLPLYPVRYHPKKDELLRRMESRGRKYLSCSGHRSYDGKTIALKRDQARFEIESDVYVDVDAYYQDFPGLKPNVGKLLRSRQDPKEVEEVVTRDSTQLFLLSGHGVDLKLSDDFLATHDTELERFKPDETEITPECYRLMPHHVAGYVFKVRKWFHLDIDLVKEIDQSEAVTSSGFNDLVIDPVYRELLVALVNNHASGLERQRQRTKKSTSSKARTQIDLVRGKGQGLIILLHGPPGSGKTSTAETIAAHTHRPLYSITCGDLGLTPDVVEIRLSDHARRADKWGCVLLLDEADVFLVQRNWDDVLRNAMVSVFLRQLEYYGGILFLTTNRPGVIDEAFKSRIHVAIRYPSVDFESTKQMWINIMNRLEADNETADVKIQFKREDLLEFARKHFQKHSKDGHTWNGRQIRNAFQTAIALGHYERLTMLQRKHISPHEAATSGKAKLMTVKLTRENFKSIAKTASEFEGYLNFVRGSDSKNARQLEVRDDDYDPRRPRANKKYPSASVFEYASPPLVSRMKSSNGGSSKGKAKQQPPSTDEESEEASDAEHDGSKASLDDDY